MAVKFKPNSKRARKSRGKIQNLTFEITARAGRAAPQTT